MGDLSIEVSDLTKTFGDRKALDRVCFRVEHKHIAALLGPNGGGKTTLFRILATLLQPDSGSARICGFDPVTAPDRVRRTLGVVFQSPSLDKKLTAAENLRHHGHLFGMRGRSLERRIGVMLEKFNIDDRANDRVETLSGGLARRVEIAKGMLSSPSVLLLDEPSTGLDPAARLELWRQLDEVRTSDGVAVLMTTHILDEAERCDRVTILDEGKVVADDSPAALKAQVGGAVITIEANKPQEVAARAHSELNLPAEVVGQSVRIESPDGNGAALIPRLAEIFGDGVHAITLGHPTLEDVFIRRTGRNFVREVD
ncbi:MAG: ABC transporter ATP-binding protein [Planctomycetes bacterium]|nr:ABC transporter ATP-binding protein [Planctomycetota bacterium]